MLIVDRIQQLIMLLLVACSGWLLGIGQQNPRIGMLAVAAAILSFILNDWLQWVRLSRWVANVVALLVTAYALRGFFHSDSAAQLIMIATLLIYLQIVLLFQIKTPRVYWQILVLSLLQIVVAAAFNIRLEGGIVFFCYLLVSGVAMVILQVHSQTHHIRIANRRTVNAMQADAEIAAQTRRPVIFTMHDQVFPNRRPLKAMIRQVFALGLVSIGFAVVTFYLLPRDEISWNGNQLASEHSPGFSRTLDLEENVRIYLSNEQVMDVTFYDKFMNRKLELPEEPYLRGMPLPELDTAKDQTRWRSANEPATPGFRTILPGLIWQDYMIQSMSLQPTSDPLLHTILPAMRLPSTPAEMEWNTRLSLLNRLVEFQTESTNLFRYDLAIPVGSNQEPFRAFPHVNLTANPALRLENQVVEYERNTKIDPKRYPGLIQLAEQEAAKVRNRDNPIEVGQALSDYLSEQGGFSYTLDFSNFDWAAGVDHVEDFVINKRRGHCEFFASALVLMLRSQKIPARVVVGYHGGDFDRDTQSYIVRSRHAHAWVEAYIPPEKCPREWFRQGQASPAGAWLRLDPTPATAAEFVPPVTPLTVAQDFWNTYVMGLNSSKQRDSAFQSFVQNPFRNVAQLFSFRYWQMQWQTFTTKGRWHQSAIFYVLVGTFALVGIVAGDKWLRSRRRIRAPVPTQTSASFKKLLGRALAIVAPRLGRWVAGEDTTHKEVPFYQRLQRILQRQGLQRPPFQTAREFSQTAKEFFANRTDAAEIRRSIEAVVDKFYWVRFSQRELSPEDLAQVELSLSYLEKQLLSNESAA